VLLYGGRSCRRRVVADGPVGTAPEDVLIDVAERVITHADST